MTAHPYPYRRVGRTGPDGDRFLLPGMPPPHWFLNRRLDEQRYESMMADLVVLLPVVESVTHMAAHAPERGKSVTAILGAIAGNEVWMWATCAWAANTLVTFLPPLSAGERYTMVAPDAPAGERLSQPQRATQPEELAARQITAVARDQWPERVPDWIPADRIRLLSLLTDALRHTRTPELVPPLPVWIVPTDPDFEARLDILVRKSAQPAPEDGPSPCGGCAERVAACACVPDADGLYPCRFCGATGAACAQRRAGREMFGECCGMCEVIAEFHGRHTAHGPRAALNDPAPAADTPQ